MEVQGQWADALMALERLFFLKLAVWGAISIVAGTALMAALRRWAPDVPALASLSLALIAAGAIEMTLAIIARRGVDLRDLAGAVALDRALWLVAGIAIGWASVAILLALRMRTRAPADAKVTGAALGFALHGIAIAMLALQLADAVVR